MVVVARATRPPDGLRPIQAQVALPWCEDDACVLGRLRRCLAPDDDDDIKGKAADHHGCFGHVNFRTHKVS